MHRDLRPIAREIVAEGFTIRQGRGNWLVVAPSGGTAASLPLTPGRGRWEKNLRAQLRTLGVLSENREKVSVGLR